MQGQLNIKGSFEYSQDNDGGVQYVLYKFFFIVCIAVHVILWPSPATVTAASVYAALSLFRFFGTKTYAQVWRELKTPGLFILQDGSRRYFAFTIFATVYFLCYFLLFVTHEVNLQPALTTWIYSGFIGNYTFNDNGNVRFSHDVWDTSSVEMRDNPFVWEKSYDYTATRLVGSIPDALTVASTGVDGDLACPTIQDTTSNFTCFTSAMKVKEPSKTGYSGHSFIPLPFKYYKLDVLVKPPAGVKCEEIELYRVNLNGGKTTLHGLDYPGSTSAIGGNPSERTCGLFGYQEKCLKVKHTFTKEEYKARLAERCKLSSGLMTLNLPPRGVDVEPETGRIGLDVFVVTRGATVDVHATWVNDEYLEGRSVLMSMWKQFVDTDHFQSWRISTSPIDIVLRFFFAAIPLLTCWYFVAMHFSRHVSDSDIILLSTIVLIPSALIFLSVGAWIPVAGCLICVVAVNQQSDIFSEKAGKVGEMLRETLLFITAACNSIQFSWLVALAAQAGYTAFQYQSSLDQLYEMSYKFIISSGASPTWIALLLPSVMVLSLSFLLGSVICLVLEVLAWKYRASSSSFSSSDAAL